MPTFYVIIDFCLPAILEFSEKLLKRIFLGFRRHFQTGQVEVVRFLKVLAEALHANNAIKDYNM